MPKFVLYVIAFYTAFWDSICQFFTGFVREQLPHYENVEAIATALDAGKYKYDRRVGGMVHPLRVQYRLSRKVPIGDCEDFAGYWAKALLSSLLAFEVYISLTYYRKHSGKLGAHATVVFRRGGTYYWADYHEPVALASRDHFAREIAAVYGEKLYGGVLYRVSDKGFREQLRCTKLIAVTGE